MHRAVREALRGDTAQDPRVREALAEALAEGPLLPDRLLAEPLVESADTLDMSFGDVAALLREEDSGFRLAFQDRERFELLLTPVKGAVPQFDAQGRYPGRLPTDADAMTSYFVPRLHVHGTLRRADGTPQRVEGYAWFEQDWGSTYYDVERIPGTPDHTWEWAGIQLGSGWEIGCIHARNTDPATGATTPAFTRATVVAPDGGVSYHDVDWQPVRHWTSLATLNTYPTAVRVRVPGLGLDVEVIAPATEGEVRTLIVGRAFWESPATVRGAMGTTPVVGTAFLQTLPTNTIGDIEHYMRRTHDIARAEAAVLYSTDATDQAALGLLTGTSGGTDLDTAARIRLHQAVAAPVLHLLDNPGRSWRPYVAAAVLCLLGADPERYRPLTAVTELLHVSALVIDDIQDNSPTRRGRPSVHEIFGTAPAITAGTLGYYTFDALIQRVPQADAATMLRIYRLYLRDLRAAHAGQALDLAGHHTALPWPPVTPAPSSTRSAPPTGSRRACSSAAPPRSPRSSAAPTRPNSTRSARTSRPSESPTRSPTTSSTCTGSAPPTNTSRASPPPPPPKTCATARSPTPWPTPPASSTPPTASACATPSGNAPAPVRSRRRTC